MATKNGGEDVDRRSPPRHQPPVSRTGQGFERDRAARFRRYHARIGVGLSEATVGVVGAYAWVGHPHISDVTLEIICAAVAVANLGIWFLIPAMARHRFHDGIFFGWSAATIVMVLIGTYLDGGEKSPIALLLFLPMLYAALEYRPRYVLMLGTGQVAGYLLVIMTDGSRPTARVSVMASTLTLTMLMATMAARNREEQAREVEALNKLLEEQATHDGLTGCLNRRGFDAAIESEVSRAIRYGRPVSLLIMDVDRLKAINDERGHGAGDDALRTVATALHGTARANDIAARLGGDEFALLVPETDLAGALRLAQRMHATLRLLADGTAPVKVSIGAAALGGQITTSDDLRRAADVALYTAKQTGRDRTERYDEPFRPACATTPLSSPTTVRGLPTKTG